MAHGTRIINGLPGTTDTKSSESDQGPGPLSFAALTMMDPLPTRGTGANRQPPPEPTSATLGVVVVPPS